MKPDCIGRNLETTERLECRRFEGDIGNETGGNLKSFIYLKT